MPTRSIASHYPLFLDLAGKSAFVIGGGNVAERKIARLLRCAAVVTVVSPLASRRIRKWHAEKRLRWIKRRCRLADLRGARLVFCATNHAGVDRKFARVALERGLLVNCAPAPELGDFILPAAVAAGPIQIAVSTSGASPALARRLAREIAHRLDIKKAARWAKLLQDLRPLIMAEVPMSRRSKLWKQLTSDEIGDLVKMNRMSMARKLALSSIEKASRGVVPTRKGIDPN